MGPTTSGPRVGPRPRGLGASCQYRRGEGARPLGFRSLEKVNGQIRNLLGPRHLPTTALPAPRRGLSLYTPYPLPIHTVGSTSTYGVYREGIRRDSREERQEQ